jgi:uncharacterized protein YjiS (DUF1127 family)
MTDISYSNQSISSENATQTTILDIAKAMANSTAETLSEWRHNYRSRRELAAYSRHERCDIGYASNIDAEIAKPFWKK